MIHNLWSDYLIWIENTYYIDKKGYDMLLDELLNSPFEAIIDRDNNRIDDGEGIRNRYLSENGISGGFIDHPISVLEVLVALACRIDSEYIGNPNDPHPESLFWEMIYNLGLNKFDNRHFNGDKIYDILSIFVTREYDFDGNGGLFPLKYPKNDQRCVEIWRQCMAYLSENYV